MKTNGTLDDISLRIVDSILEEPVFNRDELKIKVRAILNTLLKIQDRPKYDSIKTDKGKLIRTIERKQIEREFFKSKCKLLLSDNDMKSLYDELDNILENQ